MSVTPLQTVDWTTSSSIPSQLTLSRSSSATYFNSSGVLSTATSNNPRFDYKYNGTSWDAAGLIIEEQRTNTVGTNNFTDSNWEDPGAPINIGSAVTSPDGTSNAYPLIPSTATGVRQRWYHLHESTAISTVPVSMSLFVKAAGYTQFAIREAQSGGASVIYSLSGSGSIQASNSGGGVTVSKATISSIGGGWFKISAVFSVSSNTAMAMGLIPLDGGWTSGDPTSYSFAGDGTSGVICFGPQVEVGANPSSYIYTSGNSTATRAADILSTTDSTLLSAKAWAMEVGEAKPSIQSTLIGINTVTGIGPASGNALQTSVGGTQTTGNTATWTGVNRGGIAWDSTPRVSIDLNGSTVVTAANTPVTPTTVYFGNMNAGAQDFLNGHIRSWAAYSALADAELVTVSTVGASYSITSFNILVAQTLGHSDRHSPALHLIKQRQHKLWGR